MAPEKNWEHSIKLQLPAGNVGFMRRLQYSVEALDIYPNGTYSGALQNLDRVILGWGEAFSFCTNGQWIKGLDDYITGVLTQYEVDKGKLFQNSKTNAQRRMLGVRLIADTYSKRSGPT
ncbi:hypothetical protein CUB86_31455 [Pseudomonas syringae pv. actinidiae]|uniref:Uncharacterized protein n=1 Tax=Pseudomonas syringae pv. actinidiae TaxID=103796 RepID=A0AAU8XR71_PSESF|nr:hypothetical protein CT122_27190 [Pseudomonas syringae pv. actinidiae]PIN57795.1 hypothetical protein CUB86_31455 [Pseudomonas syringae pv. actinidiae]